MRMGPGLLQKQQKLVLPLLQVLSGSPTSRHGPTGSAAGSLQLLVVLGWCWCCPPEGQRDLQQLMWQELLLVLVLGLLKACLEQEC